LKMKIKTKLFIILSALLAVALIFLFTGAFSPAKEGPVMKEIRPVLGEISITVSTTGTVLPRNRLELMPSVAGRIETIYVREGDEIRKGQILALMSSTDRAALIDAARLQGSKSLEYWENAYKPIPVVAPISGTVIVRSVEPGQSVTTSDDIITISDRLNVRAEVDETDIGRVKVGQASFITLDAHPDILVKGKVAHIYYESTTVNNVTVYYVSIIPDSIPPEFRSGMSATVEIVEKEKKGIILVPEDAVTSENGEKYLLVKQGDDRRGIKTKITTGLSSGGMLEVVSGVTLDDTILVRTESFELQESESSKNIFMPEPPERGEKK